MQLSELGNFYRNSHEFDAVYKKAKSFISLDTWLPVMLYLQFTYNQS